MEQKKYTFLSDNIKSIIIIITVVAVFAYLFGITFSEVKLPKDIVPQVLIAIVAFGKDSYSWLFGNTQGSTKKDELLATMSVNPTPIATTNTGDVNVTTKPESDGKID